MNIKNLNKKLRVFAAFVLATLMFVIIVFLTQSHKRKSIEEVLALIIDENLKACIEENTQRKDSLFAYQVKELNCKLKLSPQNNPLYIKDLNGIENLRYLEKLNISSSQLKSLRPINGLRTLKSLNLSSANIFVIDDLSRLINIEELDLSNNSIENASILTRLKKIKTLNLAKNNISNISFLTKLTQLEQLNVEANLISRVPSFKKLKSLKILNLSDNKLSNVSFLSQIDGLDEINLSGNRILRVEAFSKFKSLKKLTLSNNRISNITPLSQMQVTRLNLSNNRIESGIDKLFSNLGDTESPVDSITINLEGNPNARCQDIQVLKAKLAKVQNLNLFEPKVCSSTPKTFYSTKKKRGWKFWKK